MKFVAIIPARGGSKRIPRKNIADCAGKPLLSWTAEAALGSSLLSSICLSTDDRVIADLGLSLGLEVPFMRPDIAATDQAPMMTVLQHFIDNIGDLNKDDAIVLLQPTSPLRTSDHIDRAIRLYMARDAESLVSICEAPHIYHPMKALSVQEGFLQTYLNDAPKPGHTHEVEMPTVYGRNGPAILISRVSTLQSGELYGERSLPFEMTVEDSIDVDEPVDLAMADYFLRTRRRFES
jgi:CMP-N,N'-diacetyllegionaminic acid synthase